MPHTVWAIMAAGFVFLSLDEVFKVLAGGMFLGAFYDCFRTVERAKST